MYAPLSITSNAISINLSSYALKTGVPTLQTPITASLPLSITNNNLSISLTAYQPALINATYGTSQQLIKSNIVQNIQG